MTVIYFLAHPEVIIDPNTPITSWGLSQKGRQRLNRFCAANTELLGSLTRLISSAETKALEGASIIAAHTNLQVSVHSELNEIDRSRIGYLPKAEHDAVSKLAFEHPTEDVRGRESLVHGQKRIIGGIAALCQRYPDERIFISSHAGVGTLLLCHIAREPISMKHAMRNAGGGCIFVFDALAMCLIESWVDIDEL